MNVVDFGGGADEGLAAVCGHQSGGQGMRVVKPVFSLGDRNGVRRNAPLPGTFSVLLSASISAPAHVRCARGNRPAGGCKKTWGRAFSTYRRVRFSDGMRVRKRKEVENEQGSC